jgi:hypothetical protein
MEQCLVFWPELVKSSITIVCSIFSFNIGLDILKCCFLPVTWIQELLGSLSEFKILLIKMLKPLLCVVFFLMLVIQSTPFLAVSSTYIFWQVNRSLDASVGFIIGVVPVI